MTVRTATLVQNIVRSYLILISAGITMKRHKCMIVYIHCTFADNKIRVDFMETLQKYLHRQALRRSFLGSSTFRTSPATKNMCRSDITLMSTFQESEFSFSSAFTYRPVMITSSLRDFKSFTNSA